MDNNYLGPVIKIERLFCLFCRHIVSRGNGEDYRDQQLHIIQEAQTCN